MAGLDKFWLEKRKRSVSVIRTMDSVQEASQKIGASNEGRFGWLRPDEEVAELGKRLFAAGSRSAIEIGCGAGRHALALAEIGFAVSAIDLSELALNQLRKEAKARGLEIDVTSAAMTALPYPDDCFDYTLAYHVFWHGDGDIVRAAIAEVRRVLRKGGILQAIMLSTRSTAVQNRRKIVRRTFGDHGDTDHVHPEFFCGTEALKELFAGFHWFKIEDRRDGMLPECWRWHVVLECA
ncbi:class I SAM-dependent methyltransferase [Bradyrhizobium sp. UFLA01-814]|uniref:class I SAM-dependent methyltransferase n=1 Tax=Bradyrhizobium sp. UFLA01-814 TaxID=3023480 RepID=UPI00398A72C6